MKLTGPFLSILLLLLLDVDIMWIIMVGAPAAIMDHEVTSKMESPH